MKIHTLISPVSVEDLYFAGKTTVVIDVLRATTTIVTALSNGAKEVIPVSTIGFAMKVSGNAFGGKTLLGGERNAKKIEGFPLGNSPLEYSEDIVKDKSIVLFTTNGTKAIVRAKYSDNLYICSFQNINAIAKELAELNNDIEIVCAGSHGMFSLEDSVCAGCLIERIKNYTSDISYSDASKCSVMLYNKFKNDILGMLKESEHGKLLIDYGFENDLEFASQVDVQHIVPVYNSGVIKKKDTIQSDG